MAGASGPRIVGEGSGEGERKELLDGDGDGERSEAPDEGNGDGERSEERDEGDVGSYTGGGTKLALTRERCCGSEPASMAACRSEA